MKVRELFDEIKRNLDDIGEDFLDYDIFTEQCTEEDKKYKRDEKWKTFKDEDGWEYFKCVGFWTLSKINRWFSINVNY